MSTNFEWAKAKSSEIIKSISTVIIGKDDVLRRILIGLIADGHILLEDVPGVAKTLTTSMFADVLGLNFGRIQFLPDLLPGDLTGGFIYNPGKSEFEFRQGPIFTNLLLADEINRGTPKTQSALLEAMQERQVTIDRQRFPLEHPFLVVATQNPVEFEGTYPLPEAQIDRFIMRLSFGYPDVEAEREIIARRAKRRQDEVTLPRIISREEFLGLQQTSEEVYVSPDIQKYIVDIVRATRDDKRVQLGASPRGSLALFKLCRAHALIHGRDFVIPEDVKAMAVAALAHRLVMDPDAWLERISDETVIEDILNSIPAPTVEVGLRAQP